MTHTAWMERSNGTEINNRCVRACVCMCTRVLIICTCMSTYDLCVQLKIFIAVLINALV